MRQTRMVQLPATAAIEYVAACWVSGAGRFLSGGAFVRGSFARGTFQVFLHNYGQKLGKDQCVQLST